MRPLPSSVVSGRGHFKNLNASDKRVGKGWQKPHLLVLILGYFETYAGLLTHPQGKRVDRGVHRHIGGCNPDAAMQPSAWQQRPPQLIKGDAVLFYFLFPYTFSPYLFYDRRLKRFIKAMTKSSSVAIEAISTRLFFKESSICFCRSLHQLA